MKSITKAQKAISDFDKQVGGMDKTFSDIKSSLADSLTVPSENFEGLASSLLPADLVSSIGDFGNVIENVKSSYSSVVGMFSGFDSILSNVSGFAPAFVKGISIASGIGVVIAEVGLLQESFGTQIQNLLLQIQTVGPTLITNLCNGIVAALPNLMMQGATLITSLLDTITILLPSIISAGFNIISALISGIGLCLPTLVPAALNVVIALVTGLIENIPQLIYTGLQLLMGIVQGLLNAIPVLVESLPAIITSIVNTLTTHLPTILQMGIELLVMIVNGIVQAIPMLWQALPTIIFTIIDAFSSTDWCQIGKDILISVIDGLESMVRNLWDTVKNIVSGIVESFSFSFTSDGKMKSGSVPHLAHGTDNWSGGFAYMNEGGRGELTYLPNGSQVIPHDISVKYAKEAARANTANSYTDLNGLGNYIVAAVAETSQIYAQKLAEGISGMRMTVNNREAARFVADLGFVRR